MRITILTLLVFLLLASCERVLMPTMPESRMDIFHEIWEHLDQNYIFFDYKGVNWDQVYTNYKPLVSESMTDEEFYHLMGSMVVELRDRHTWLGWGNRGIVYDFTKGAERNFCWELIEGKYLANTYFTANRIIYKNLNGIGYIYIPNFWDGNEHEPFKEALCNMEGITGLIIDIRDNGGGNNFGAKLIPGHFTTEPQLVGQWRRKSGQGRDALTPTDFDFLYPREPHFPHPVVVLVNRWVYSTANGFASDMGQLPSATLIGDTTGGGGGVPREYLLSNGWVIRCSDTYSLNGMGVHIENGIAPNIAIAMDTTSIDTDEILERAIAVFTNSAK
jgi:hypothetical protein